jgi:hypothetical protein
VKGGGGGAGERRNMPIHKAHAKGGDEGGTVELTWC